MKIVGKTDKYAEEYPYCPAKLKVNLNGQDVIVRCVRNRRSTHRHEGTAYLQKDDESYPIKSFEWNESEINVEEERSGLARFLLDCIPEVKDMEFDWPCTCSHCPEMRNMQWSLHTTIVTLNDQCMWGRTPEEDSDRNIIDWLNSLGIDFSIRI